MVTSRRVPQVVLLSLVLAGCGAGAPSRVDQETERQAEDEQRVAAWGASVDQLDEQLGTALDQVSRGEPAPDCEAICRLAFQICQLSDRICVIQERNPGSESIDERCTEATERCRSAEEDTDDMCDCEQFEFESETTVAI